MYEPSITVIFSWSLQRRNGCNFCFAIRCYRERDFLKIVRGFIQVTLQLTIIRVHLLNPAVPHAMPLFEKLICDMITAGVI